MSTNQVGSAWDEALVQRITATAKELRGKRSAKWLSERTAELGYPISPQTIARMDTGRRAGHFEVAELLVIARALNVPPIALLYPDLPNGVLEDLPGVELDSWSAAKLFSGELIYPVPSDDVASLREAKDRYEPLRLLRLHDAAVARLMDSIAIHQAATETAHEAGSPAAFNRESQPDEWSASLAAEREVAATRARRKACELDVYRARRDLRAAGIEPPVGTDFIDSVIDKLLDESSYLEINTKNSD